MTIFSEEEDGVIVGLTNKLSDVMEARKGNRFFFFLMLDVPLKTGAAGKEEYERYEEFEEIEEKGREAVLSKRGIVLSTRKGVCGGEGGKL